MKRIIGLLILLIASPVMAQTIDNLSAGTTIVGTELLPMFQTANPAVSTTPSAIGTYITGRVNTFATGQIVNGTLRLGTISSVTGQLLLANSASANLTTIQAGNAAAARTYTWPTNFGAAGTVLTDAAGNGTLSWTAISTDITVGTTTITSGTTGRIAYDNGGVFGEALLTYSAAVLQLGAADVNGSPVAQTLKVQSALAGSATNTASANTTIIGSLGTGTGTNGDIILQTGVKTTTGTAQGTATTALTIKGETQQAQFVRGTASANAITFGGDTNYGIYSAAQGYIAYANNGTIIAGMDGGSSGSGSGGNFVIYSGRSLNFDSGGSSGSLFLLRAANATLQIGGQNVSSAIAQTLQVQSIATGATNVAGADWTLIGSKGTGTGVGGKIIMQVALTGSTGTTQNSAFPMLTLNPGAAGTATVQFGDGSNFTTYDNCTALTTGATGVIACTASAEYLKNIYSNDVVTPFQASVGLDKLRVGAPVWDYKNPALYGEGVRVGLIADDIAAMDSRCIVRRDGKVFDYWDRCIIAYLVADRQQMKAEIAALKSK